MQPSLAETLSRLPLTRTLAATIARAHDYATQQSHRFVTLEHLLLALAEDAEAAVVLQASSIDLVGLATEVAAHVGRIDDRVAAGQPVLPNINADVIRILEYSAAATRQSRRGREISGAVVLADNIFTFKKTLRPYVTYMQDRANGFDSVTLPLGHGMEYSVRRECALSQT